MNDVKQRNRRRRQRKRSQNHKRSVLAISAVVLMLTVMVSANSMTLKAKNREYQAQETELKEQIQAEQDRKKEIKELEKYVGTDKYVEDVAKEKLGLVHDNEIVFILFLCFIFVIIFSSPWGYGLVLVYFIFL